MKKTILITIIIAVLAIASAYLTDIYRISNNMDVIFGTWGHKYAPPAKSGDISKVGTLEENESGEIIEQKEINIDINNHTLNLSLPIDWNYEILEQEENGSDGGVKFYTSDPDKYAKISVYGENKMGVCGTDLTEKEIELNNGQKATIGYYGTDTWEFIYLNLRESENYDIWVMNQGLEDDDALRVLDIVKTINLNDKASSTEYNEFEITVKEATNKDKKKILNNKDLHSTNTDYNLYYFGLEEVYIKINDKSMALENALKEGYLTLDGIPQKADKDVSQAISANSDKNTNIICPTADYCNDGGSIEYHYKDYTIIKLNRLDGNQDIYIGIPNLKVDDLGL